MGTSVLHARLFFVHICPVRTPVLCAGLSPMYMFIQLVYMCACLPCLLASHVLHVCLLC